MPDEIGEIEALFRYPVKSMRGQSLDAATLGWHGIDGDRRFALRRRDLRGPFPWLSASKLPELVLYTPRTLEGGAAPTHVRTPEGMELPILGEELAAHIAARHGAIVEMMQLKDGIFDDASISVITSRTVEEIGRLAGIGIDVRRFRPNVVLRSTGARPFEENDWVGGTLVFGDGAEAPAVSVTVRDPRCAMVNIDPDSASTSPGVFQSIVRANAGDAGIYATVTRVGELAIGQRVVLRR